jgi:1,2-dihydroxy-3-keto-5-methylthiopentene dioxygenase
MSSLKVFRDDASAAPQLSTSDRGEITRVLEKAGVRFEQWESNAQVQAGDSSESVIAAYRTEIERLIAEDGYQTVDVISLDADAPGMMEKVPELRQKFLSEHRHTEDEVRFFVDGKGLFSLHIGNNVYEVLCEKGDLISVPANTPHWFDMGPRPSFVAIRFFNNQEGWVAHYSGSPIAEQFSRLEA